MIEKKSKCIVILISLFFLFSLTSCGSSKKDEKSQVLLKQILLDEESFKSAGDEVSQNEVNAFALSVIQYVGYQDDIDEDAYNLVVRASKYLKDFLNSHPEIEDYDFLSLQPTLIAQQAWYVSKSDQAVAAGLVKKVIGEFNNLVLESPSSLILRINRAFSFSKFPNLFNTKPIAIKDLYYVLGQVKEKKMKLPLELQHSLYKTGVKLVDDLAGDFQVTDTIKVADLKDEFDKKFSELEAKLAEKEKK